MKHLLAAALAIVFLAPAARALAEGNGNFAKEGIKVEAGSVR